MTLAKPKAIIFDIIETVFALDAVRGDLVGLGLSEDDLETWFAFGLRDAFTLNATCALKPFPDILKAALTQLLAIRGHKSSEDQRATVFETMRSLPPHPDAGEAFKILNAADIPLYALSNGAKASTQNLLDQAGLSDHFTEILSVETIGQFKPSKAVYDHAVEAVGEAAGDMLMVATHAWDIHGAKSAGLMGAFVSRGQAFPDTMLAPDIMGDQLSDVARTIAALQ